MEVIRDKQRGRGVIFLWCVFPYLPHRWRRDNYLETHEPNSEQVASCRPAPRVCRAWRRTREGGKQRWYEAKGKRKKKKHTRGTMRTAFYCCCLGSICGFSFALALLPLGVEIIDNTEIGSKRKKHTRRYKRTMATPFFYVQDQYAFFVLPLSSFLWRTNNR